MRFLVLLAILIFVPRVIWAGTVQAPSGLPPDGLPSYYYDMKREAAAKSSSKSSSIILRAPGLRACYYPSTEDVPAYDVARSELHSTSCQSPQSIDNQLPDRPEQDIYRVGEPFDVPKRN